MSWKPGLTRVYVVTHYYDSELTVVGVWASRREAARNLDRLRVEIPGGTLTLHPSLLEY